MPRALTSGTWSFADCDPKPMREDMLSLADVELAIRLGLGNLNQLPKVCGGYRNGCECAGCLRRENPPVAPVRLPWENAA